MKYIVMECHEGYAVLMDEDSRFVKAANLRYEIGQTITDPVMMQQEETDRARKITVHVSRFIAVAACLVIMASAGSVYYSHNLKPHSTVLISSNANIRIELNKKGKVLHLRSDDNAGKEILKDYDGKGKDMLTVTNEILQIEKEKGFIANGDTVDLYISSDDSKDYSSYKNDFVNGIPDMNVKVHGIDAPHHEVKKPDPAKTEPAKPEAPKPPAEDTKLPEPPAPAVAADSPAPDAPAAPPAPAKDSVKQPEVKVTPPAHPDQPETPEPPKENVKPGEEKAPEPPKPADEAEPPKPEVAPPRHDPKIFLREKPEEMVIKLTISDEMIILAAPEEPESAPEPERIDPPPVIQEEKTPIP